jgi:hypothetical protein
VLWFSGRQGRASLKSFPKAAQTQLAHDGHRGLIGLSCQTCSVIAIQRCEINIVRLCTGYLKAARGVQLSAVWKHLQRAHPGTQLVGFTRKTHCVFPSTVLKQCLVRHAICRWDFSSFECGRVFSSIRSMNRTKCPLMRERAQLPTCPPRSSRGQVQHLQVPVLQRSACRMPSNSIHPALPGGAVATAGASRDAKHVTTDAVPLRNRLARVYLCRRLLDKPARRLRHVENGTRFASGSVSR